jgi:acyl-lipid omega-6 desaturase (Delta-12 desaturase)
LILERERLVMPGPQTTLPIAADADDPAAVRARLLLYARPRIGRSLLELGTSLVPYVLLSAVMYRLVDVSVPLTLALAIPTTGFLLRTYMVFHDCAHGSFLPWRRANQWLGTICGILLFESFSRWRHSHAMHHASAGDLDRRGVGDVPTLTVDEYRRSPWRRRLGYRLFRNPLVMFGIGPVYALMVQPRLAPRSLRPNLRRSVVLTNLAIAALIGTLCLLFGWRAYLLVQMPSALLAGAAGVWLFYVQHQFEDTYWERGGDWSYTDAALRGSSHLALPGLLRFFTSNIGLHHVHHLNPRIPSYNLQRAHDENPVFHGVPKLSLRDGLRAVRLKLWDEEHGRLVTFAAVRAG